MAEKHAYRFEILGRYPATLKDNATAVTVAVAAGEKGRLVHAGTLTMSEEEWSDFIEALEGGLAGNVEVKDHTSKRHVQDI
jgi:hypothetical protein